MYDKAILAKSTGASLGVVAVVGMLFLSTGTAFAMPVSGIGGFTIQADEIQGNNMIMYPGVGDAENMDHYPQAVVELTKTKITNMRLMKTFHLGDYGIPGLSGNARIVITAGNESNKVVSDSILMKTPALSANEATFNGMVIDEDNVTKSESGLRKLITLRAPASPSSEELQGGTRSINLTGGSNPGMVMENANIRATYLATNQITLPNMGLEVQYDPDGDNVYEYQ
ncbi:MAG: DUF6230 family protein [Haloarculaceae archaeon]